MTNSESDRIRELNLRRTEEIRRREESMLERAAEDVGLEAGPEATRIQGKVQPTFRKDYERHGGSAS
ncbi:hypothetical protein [Synechococcus elongatus]|uniref:Uncharacterized protein n=2 Tax=Synechococcus elongatus TaxID=32046 RepID=A0AAN1QLI1_SYNEL|nr:hypothetical protein [Synechococcus elongatus]AZB71541.1 hypothetical protein DOP62_01285 [Synechococcus elongatus PCC 11801]QFZ91058.1 hypothetical protein EKO22_00495 [Synechococcus elongatus PCC 11802]